MPRYIDAEIFGFIHFKDRPDKTYADGIQTVMEFVDSLPSAQPETMYYPQVDGVTPSVIVQPERKKGKWIKGGEQPYFRKHFDIVVCSICNKRGEHRWNFCPNCGADMRERRTDGEQSD